MIGRVPELMNKHDRFPHCAKLS